jgi:hypothetical protein
MVLSVRKEEITVQGKNRSESGGALNDIFPELHRAKMVKMRGGENDLSHVNKPGILF